MTIQQFIERAIEGGWLKTELTPVEHKAFVSNMETERRFFLDPEAWKAVGKVEGWELPMRFNDEWVSIKEQPVTWYAYMMRMVTALAEGKTIEQYLETL